LPGALIASIRSSYRFTAAATSLAAPAIQIAILVLLTTGEQMRRSKLPMRRTKLLIEITGEPIGRTKLLIRRAKLLIETTGELIRRTKLPIETTGELIGRAKLLIERTKLPLAIGRPALLIAGLPM
jgi:hypothetical protein